MEKIIFFVLVIPIMAYVLYLGGMAVMNGFKSKEAKAKNRIFTPVESDIYTLYSLITLLKGYAVEQGLEKTEETAIDKDAFKNAADKAMEESKNPVEILNNLTKHLGELS